MRQEVEVFNWENPCYLSRRRYGKVRDGTLRSATLPWGSGTEATRREGAVMGFHLEKSGMKYISRALSMPRPAVGCQRATHDGRREDFLREPADGKPVR